MPSACVVPVERSEKKRSGKKEKEKIRGQLERTT